MLVFGAFSMLLGALGTGISTAVGRSKARRQQATAAAQPPLGAWGAGGAQAVGSAWVRDPSGRHEYRYWDGVRWTDQVSDRGTSGSDPL